jgi:hypothetical protein
MLAQPAWIVGHSPVPTPVLVSGITAHRFTGQRYQRCCYAMPVNGGAIQFLSRVQRLRGSPIRIGGLK